MALRLANVEKLDRYESEDGDWIDLRAEITKAEMNQLALVAPKQGPEGEAPSVESQLEFLHRFGAIVTMAWSLTDSNGNPEAFSIDTYMRLDPDSAAWIDSQWTTQLSKLMGGGIEELEEKQEK